MAQDTKQVDESPVWEIYPTAEDGGYAARLLDEAGRLIAVTPGQVVVGSRGLAYRNVGLASRLCAQEQKTPGYLEVVEVDE